MIEALNTQTIPAFLLCTGCAVDLYSVCHLFQNHRAADAAFCQLVDDPTYKQEVKDKLFCLRLKQLEELGYNSNEAFTALHKSGNQSVSL